MRNPAFVKSNAWIAARIAAKEFWVHADGRRVEIISTNRRIEVRGARFGIDGWLSCEECREFLASQGYTREQK